MARRSSVISILITGDAKGLNKALGGAETKFGSFGAKATAAIGAATAAIGGLAAFSVREFAKFDQALNQSLAIMGDVSDALRTEMETAARDVAKTTTFSAEQAAESYFFLASAGLDAASSIAAMPQVARFAQAGMFDMALATDLLTDAQSALGLTVRDDAVANLENMARVSDVLVRANTLANASVQQFSESLTNKAAAALRALGKDVEEGVAVLAAFADQGVKGDYAGTQLAIVLRDLTTKGLQNADAFREAGVQVFDAAGEMRNLGAIVADLEGLLDGMSDATQKATLLQLGFSDKSLGAIQALLGMSDAIAGYETELRSASGFTDTVASKQLESFSAQVDLLKSNFLDIALGIGQRLEPALSAVVAFLQEKGPQIEAFVGNVVTGIETFLTNAREKGTEFKAAFDERFKQPIIDFKDSVLTAVENIGTKFDEVKSEAETFVTALTTPFREFNAEADATSLGQALGEAILTAFGELKRLSEPLMTKFKEFIASIDWFALGMEAVQYLVQFFTGLVVGFFGTDWYTPLLQSLRDNWQPVLIGIASIMFAPAKWAGALARALGRIPLLGRLLSWATTALNNLGGRIASGLKSWVWDPFAAAFGRVLNTAGPGLIARLAAFVRGIPAAFRAGFDDALLAVGQFFENLGIRVANALLPLKQRWTTLLDEIGLTIRSYIQTFREIGGNLVRGIWQGIRDMGSWLAGKFRNFIDDTVNGVKHALGIRSPSTVFADLGMNVGRGFAEGITASSRLVSAATAGLTHDATASVTFDRPEFGGLRADDRGQTIVNVTVTSADPQAVVEAIRRYTRRNGPLSASVTV